MTAVQHSGYHVISDSGITKIFLSIAGSQHFLENQRYLDMLCGKDVFPFEVHVWLPAQVTQHFTVQVVSGISPIVTVMHGVVERSLR